MQVILVLVRWNRALSLSSQLRIRDVAAINTPIYVSVRTRPTNACSAFSSAILLGSIVYLRLKNKFTLPNWSDGYLACTLTLIFLLLSNGWQQTTLILSCSGKLCRICIDSGSLPLTAQSYSLSILTSSESWLVCLFLLLLHAERGVVLQLHWRHCDVQRYVSILHNSSFASLFLQDSPCFAYHWRGRELLDSCTRKVLFVEVMLESHGVPSQGSSSAASSPQISILLSRVHQKSQVVELGVLLHLILPFPLCLFIPHSLN